MTIGPKLVHRLADDVHHAAQRPVTHGNADRAAEVNRFHAANETIGGLHRDATHAAFAQVLLHFKNDVNRRRNVEAFAHHTHGLIDRRQVALGELHVHRGTGDLNYFANVVCHIRTSFQYSVVGIHYPSKYSSF